MRNRGLTLLQMLISIVIVTLISAILLPVFAGSSRPDPRDAQVAYGTISDTGSLSLDMPAGTVYASKVVRR